MTIYQSERPRRGKAIAGLVAAVVTAFGVAIATGAGDAAWHAISEVVGLDSSPGPSPAGSTAGSPQASASSGRPGSDVSPTTPSSPPPRPITVHLYNVQFYREGLDPSALVVAVPATDRRVTVRVTGLGDTSIGGDLVVCPAPEDGSAVPVDLCRDVVAGADVTLSAVRGVAVEVTDPAGLRDDVPRSVERIDVTYHPAQTTVHIELPLMREGMGGSLCKDNGCNPFVEITPFYVGRVTVHATWRQSNGLAVLLMESGDVAAHGRSAYGYAYHLIATARTQQYETDLEIGGAVYGKEYAIEMVCTSGLLAGPVLDVAWSPS